MYIYIYKVSEYHSDTNSNTVNKNIKNIQDVHTCYTNLYVLIVLK